MICISFYPRPYGSRTDLCFIPCVNSVFCAGVGIVCKDAIIKSVSAILLVNWSIERTRQHRSDYIN